MPKFVRGDKHASIPQAWLDKNMTALGLNLEEAVDLYFDDEGLTDNEEVIALTAKAKTAGAGAKATGDRKERKVPVRQPDDVKRAIIAGIASDIGTRLSTEVGFETLEITNIERMIAFEYGGEKYELTLTKKRKPKK